jgi:hypothetical protein
MLQFLQEFLKVVFLGFTMKSLLDTPSVWSGVTTNQMRVPAQLFLEIFSKAFFLGVAMKLIHNAPIVWSG